MTTELLRQPEAAEYLGVSVRYLRQRSDVPVVLRRVTERKAGRYFAIAGETWTHGSRW